jgi:hypothetical protein
MLCTDKFGKEVTIPKDQHACDMSLAVTTPNAPETLARSIIELLDQGDSKGLYGFVKKDCLINFKILRWCCGKISEDAQKNDIQRRTAIYSLTLLNDLRYSTGNLKRSSVLRIIRSALKEIFAAIAPIGSAGESIFRLLTWNTRNDLIAPQGKQTTLVSDAYGFPPEGDNCDARLVCEAYRLGWKQFICYGYRGQRFLGCGLGPETSDVKIDV